MDLRPDRLIIQPINYGLNQLKRLGGGLLEMMDGERTACRLIDEQDDYELRLVEKDINRIRHDADVDDPDQLLMLQSRFCAKIVARGLVQAHWTDEAELADRILLLKRVMYDDLDQKYTFDQLHLDAEEIRVLREYFPDF